MASFADWVRKSGLLPSDSLSFALDEQKRTGFRLGQILVDHGIVDETELFDAVARTSGFARLDMSTTQVDLEAARRIDPEWALDHRIMPLSVDAQGLTVRLATTDPSQSALLSDAAGRFGLTAHPLVATESELGRLIRHAYFNEPLDRTRGGTRPPDTPDTESRVGPEPTRNEVRRINLPPFPSRSTPRPPPDAVTEPAGPLPPKGLAYASRPQTENPPEPPSTVPPSVQPPSTEPPSVQPPFESRTEPPSTEPPADSRTEPPSSRFSVTIEPRSARASDASAFSEPPSFQPSATASPSSRPPTAHEPPSSLPSAVLSFPESNPVVTPMPRSTPSAILPFPASNPATTPHPSSNPSTLLPFPASNPATTPHPDSGPSTGLPFPASDTNNLVPRGPPPPMLTGATPPMPYGSDEGIYGPTSSRDLSLNELAPTVEMHQYTASAIEIIFELCVARGIITREEYLARLGTQDFPPQGPQ